MASVVYSDDKIEEILYRENLKIPPISQRIWAFGIDIILVVLLTWGVYINLLSASSGDIVSKIYSIQKLILTYFLLGFFYEVVMIRFFNASIGKMIFGHRIISLQTLDIPLFKTILQRSALKILEEIFGFVLFIFAIDNSFHRGIHDRFSKTIVILER